MPHRSFLGRQIPALENTAVLASRGKGLRVKISGDTSRRIVSLTGGTIVEKDQSWRAIQAARNPVGNYSNAQSFRLGLEVIERNEIMRENDDLFGACQLSQLAGNFSSSIRGQTR